MKPSWDNAPSWAQYLFQDSLKQRTPEEHAEMARKMGLPVKVAC